MLLRKKTQMNFFAFAKTLRYIDTRKTWNIMKLRKPRCVCNTERYVPFETKGFTAFGKQPRAIQSTSTYVCMRAMHYIEQIYL